MITHTSRNLREHQLLLEQSETGYRLIDWMTFEPATKERVRAFIAEATARKFYPGPEILADLEVDVTGPGAQFVAPEHLYEED